ncbi:methionyl-tRNA formyltransferase, partial [bacterium]|nr:methionyl-tRNA formyltransferase [bacterium]
MPPLRKVVFCGTPDFAVPILDAVSAYLGNRLTAVFSRPDSHQGRGQKLTASPVKLRATELGLPIYTPESKLEVKQIFGRIKPDLAIVVAYGIIFPRSVVESYYCVNIHGSLLPKYRGASPIQAAILNGDTETGITLIRMNNKMDQGPILKMAELP